MTTNGETLDRLHHLELLYRQGYRSEIVDQSLKKIIALEKTAAMRQLADLQGRLRKFETQYQMASADFYRRFRAGELGDAADFIEWSAFYEMQESVHGRLKILEIGTA